MLVWTPSGTLLGLLLYLEEPLCLLLRAFFKAELVSFLLALDVGKRHLWLAKPPTMNDFS